MIKYKFKNKAKCALCLDILESKHRHDFTKCCCGEIWIDGGNDYWRAGACDWNNFIRLEEELDDSTL